MGVVNDARSVRVTSCREEVSGRVWELHQRGDQRLPTRECASASPGVTSGTLMEERESSSGEGHMRFPFMSQDGNVVEVLRKDHERVKALFRDFESAESGSDRERIVKEAIRELERHAVAEEVVFYPAVRGDAPAAADKLDEALEEHHLAKVLIAELKDMSAGDERFAAKFRVLAESVRHHIKEEEAEIFARARTGSLDLMALSDRLERAKARPVALSTRMGARRKVTAGSSAKRRSPQAKPAGRRPVRRPAKRSAG